MQLKHPRLVIGLTLVMTAALAIASYYGAFVPTTYAHDSVSMGTQGMGQDVFDLFIVVPLLLILLIFTLRGSRVAFLILGGTVFYVLYSYVIYAFGVHFNSLFLVYCTVFGTSFYLFLLCIVELNDSQARHRNGNQIPNRATGIFFVIIAVLFYLLWLKDVVPAIFSNSVPASVADNDLLVNPVHVLDIAVALPGLIVTALLLFKKHPLGYLFAPFYLVFTILLALALIAMVVAVKQKGLSEDISIAGIFAVLAAISAVFLYQFLRNTDA
jgi:hypothetical protein